MSRQACRLLARGVRAARIVCAAAAVMLVSSAVPTLSHEGHDHGQTPRDARPTAGSPRVAATSERYQFVGIVEGEVLVIYLDRADDNEPVTGATIEVSLNGETFKAELQEKAGTYEVTVPLLRKTGTYEVLVALSEGGVQDLLVGTLTIPATSGQADAGRRGLSEGVAEAMKSLGVDRKAVALAGVVLLAAAAGGALLSGRRRLLIVPAAILGLILASAVAWAHEGHDHGPDLSVSAGNSPYRRPDGTLFVPKPTQRLLEIRTRVARVESRPRTVRFHGRIVPNPNRSGVVQHKLLGPHETTEV